MAREGDYNFHGSALDRGVQTQPQETSENGYSSTFLDKTKIATPQPKNDSALTLANTEPGSETRQGDYHFHGSALDRGVEHQPRQTDTGYSSTFLDETKTATPAAKGDSAVTLESTGGAETREGDFNFQGSALERGVENEPRVAEDGYSSTFLDATKIETPDPQGESSVTLENPVAGAETRKGDFNFEGSALERGVENKPRVTEDGYSSTFLDTTKIETPDPQGESTVTPVQGAETREGDFNFEGSALDRGVGTESVGWASQTDSEKGVSSTYASPFLEKTKIPTPVPTGDSAVTLGNST